MIKPPTQGPNTQHKKTCCHCFETTRTQNADEATPISLPQGHKSVYFSNRRTFYLVFKGKTGFIYELHTSRYEIYNTGARYARVPRQLNVPPERDGAMALE